MVVPQSRLMDASQRILVVRTMASVADKLHRLEKKVFHAPASESPLPRRQCASLASLLWEYRSGPNLSVGLESCFQTDHACHADNVDFLVVPAYPYFLNTDRPMTPDQKTCLVPGEIFSRLSKLYSHTGENTAVALPSLCSLGDLETTSDFHRFQS